MTINNNVNTVSLESLGSMGTDFSSTCYGMLNPLLCDTKCMSFLNEFKEADKPVKKVEKRNVSYIDLLISEFGYQLKKGSIQKAKIGYDKIIKELSKGIPADEEIDEQQIKDKAKELIEKQLDINFDEEYRKCCDKAISYYGSKPYTSSKKVSRPQKYAQRPKVYAVNRPQKYSSRKTFSLTGAPKLPSITSSSIGVVSNDALSRSFELSRKLMSSKEASEFAGQCTNAWDKAASVLGTSKFFAASLAAAWIAVIFSSCN